MGIYQYLLKKKMPSSPTPPRRQHAKRARPSTSPSPSKIIVLSDEEDAHVPLVSPPRKRTIATNLFGVESIPLWVYQKQARTPPKEIIVLNNSGSRSPSPKSAASSPIKSPKYYPPRQVPPFRHAAVRALVLKLPHHMRRHMAMTADEAWLESIPSTYVHSPSIRRPMAQRAKLSEHYYRRSSPSPKKLKLRRSSSSKNRRSAFKKV